MFSFAVVLGLLCVANVISARDPLDCVETAKRFGSINFISALDDAKLTDTVRTLNISTLFVPTNQAFLQLADRFRQQYQNDSKWFDTTLRNHIINGTNILYEDLKDEHEYTTLAANATVRANDYNRTTTEFYKTINGAVINKDTRNVLCGNGSILHFIDQLITSVSVEDVLPLIQRNSSFSTFMKIFNASTPVAQQSLRQQEGETVFVPDDVAFNQQMTNDTINSILNNTKLASEVLMTHVINSNVWFSQGLADNIQIKNAQGTNLNVAWDKQQNKFTINGASFVDYDIAGKNGVFHIVDHVLWKANATTAAKLGIQFEAAL